MSLELIYKDLEKRSIEGVETTPLKLPRSYYLLKVTARAKGKQQLGTTDDEDLIVKIDNKSYPNLENSKRLLDSPAAFSGGSLHGLSKTIYFLTALSGGEHKIILETDKPSNSTILEELVLYQFEMSERLTVPINLAAEDGDRRPWVTFAFDNIPLKNISYKVQYTRRKNDSDDLQIKVDGKTTENSFRNFKHWLWRFAGSILPFISASREDVETLSTNFNSSLHYLEFWADRMPTLKEIILYFGQTLPSLGRIPTTDDPKWTGNFYDDPSQILLARAIFAESRSEPEECQIGVGWVIRNRVEDVYNRWGKTYHSVILAPYQFEPFINLETSNSKAMVNPLVGNNKETWLKAYKIAGLIIGGEVKDVTLGANHFIADYATASWQDPKKLTRKIGTTLFYKL